MTPTPRDTKEDEEEEELARVDGQTVTPPERATAAENEPAPTVPRRIWVLHCPFRKDGTPVLGTFGATTKPVVIFTMATWKKLCEDVPQLQTTQFEVGSYE